MEGKVALVTGAGSGIGRESALAFSRAGAKVVVSDIAVDGGEETVRMITDAGGDAIFVECDVAQEGDVKALVAKTVETYGKLDCAHNNAGIEGMAGPCAECTEENWDRTIGINLKGVWWCCKYEIPEMLRNGGGAIVNTSSVAGLVGFAGIPAYTASKHGVVGLTKTIALDYAKENIRCNAVCPGVIHTPMVDRFSGGTQEGLDAMAAMEPVGRLGQPSEIADAVVYLCSDQASFVTGIAMPVDGAFVAQ
ncbi:MAG: short chain dehydrogenase [Actinobacteria bacterium HGW-Actinobacteria-10]|jgi:NAD(P)-dependent dehydrogenase (short-subunit alcohol dehydrogenase family)|nr:MAG: short chain dehydrogenase [Actinobacteria bacterium HGW-Actinobacteria-10]